MTYFEPLNLIVFALVAEIAIYLCMGGNKKVFVHQTSHKIDPLNDFVPISMDVA
mgnify:CR=1 FL=1|jgi:hypothetical protein